MSKQLEEWTGEFGNEYTERNIPDEKNIQNRMQFLGGIFSMLPVHQLNEPKTILEVGANVGANLVALSNLYSLHNKSIELCALEPNFKARQILKNQSINRLKIIDGTAQKIELGDYSIDIVMTCGLLIHLNSDDLIKAIHEIYRVSKRFIICAEYFSPTERPIEYQGKSQLLWLRDYGSIFLNEFPSLRCLGFGFSWKRVTGIDNLTWWVFEKVN